MFQDRAIQRLNRLYIHALRNVAAQGHGTQRDAMELAVEKTKAEMKELILKAQGDDIEKSEQWADVLSAIYRHSIGIMDLPIDLNASLHSNPPPPVPLTDSESKGVALSEPLKQGDAGDAK